MHNSSAVAEAETLPRAVMLFINLVVLGTVTS